jgi:hypothetical protein
MYDIKEFTFVEQPVFTQQLIEIANRDDESYRLFQLELALRPEFWPVVKGAGGLRKARMRLPGRGKSGSARVLYLWFKKRRTLCLYLIYTKGDIENVPNDQLKAIRHEVQRIKKAFGEED